MSEVGFALSIATLPATKWPSGGNVWGLAPSQSEKLWKKALEPCLPLFQPG